MSVKPSLGNLISRTCRPPLRLVGRTLYHLFPQRAQMVGQGCRCVEGAVAAALDLGDPQSGRKVSPYRLTLPAPPTYRCGALLRGGTKPRISGSRSLTDLTSSHFPGDGEHA